MVPFLSDLQREAVSSLCHMQQSEDGCMAGNLDSIGIASALSLS